MQDGDQTQETSHETADAVDTAASAATSPAARADGAIDAWFNDQRLNFGPTLSTLQFNQLHDAVLTLKTAVAAALA